jgi:Undecaprenyl-phosphate glucose phosphotransferase
MGIEWPEPSLLTADQKMRPVSMPVVSGMLRVSDLSTIWLSGCLIEWVIRAPYGDEFVGATIVLPLIGVFGAGILFQLCGLYSPTGLIRSTTRLDLVLGAWGIIPLLIFADDLAFVDRVNPQIVLGATLWFAIAGIGLASARVVLSSWLERLGRNGRLARRTVIVGTGEQGQRLATHISAMKDPQTRIVGFVDDRRSRAPDSACGYPVLGTTETLIEMIRRNEVDQVLVALPWTAERRVHELVFQLAVTPVRIGLCPDLAGLHFADRKFTDVSGLAVLRLFDRPISGISYTLKMIEDVVLGTLLLLLSAPIFLIAGLAIKLESPGPIFFRQKRYGFNDNLIEVWKFRTMYHDHTDHYADLQVTRNDPRVTRIGAILRRTSLDELPQLINVLKGDMSIVGPRPHPLRVKAAGKLFSDAVARYSARHRVKPGITGWAQVNGWRGETDTLEKIQRRVEFDIAYIDNWSIWFDLKIILLTIPALLRDENVY